MSEWKRVIDELPENDHDMLVCGVSAYATTKGETVTTIGWYNESDWTLIMESQGNKLEAVTHWMPIPQPPTP